MNVLTVSQYSYGAIAMDDMDDSSYRLNFILGKKNEIYHHS